MNRRKIIKEEGLCMKKSYWYIIRELEHIKLVQIQKLKKILMNFGIKLQKKISQKNFVKKILKKIVSHIFIKQPKSHQKQSQNYLTKISKPSNFSQ